MFTVLPFETDHLLAIHPDPHGSAALIGEANLQRYAERFSGGPAVTLFKDDEPVACGGIVLMWPGVGEAWIVFGEKAYRYPKEIFRVCLRFMASAIKHFKLVRIQASTVAEFEEANRWAEHLGFIMEGTRRKYMGGQDYNSYALIVED